MKLNSSLNTETNCTLKETSFSIKSSPIAFDILSNKLYSNPILAIVRELLCNAYDSHVVAGTTDIPIDVIFPNNLESNFIIRDYGTGLSKEAIYELYTTFFSSNKCNSNLLTGGFGLGSKTPFAYTSSFTVTSYYNSIEYKYLITKKDGYPVIYEISSNSTTEHNGLKISIPVDKNHSSSVFFEEFKKYISYIPEIKINSNKEYTYPITVYTNNNVKCYYNVKRNREYVYIKQGQNIYSVCLSNYKIQKEYYSILSNIANYLDIVIEVPIGTINITPNREQLSSELKNIKTIENLLLSTSKVFIEDIFTFITSLRKNINNIHFNDLFCILYNKKYLNEVNLRIQANWRDEIYLIFPYNILGTRYTILNNEINSMKDINSFREGMEYIILYTYNISTKSSKYKKFLSVLRNYEEEFKNKYFLLININNELLINKSYLQYVRNMYNLIWYTNNLPDINFNISCTSLSKFIKKYPNNKNKTNKNTVNEDNLYLDYAEIVLDKTSVQSIKECTVYTLKSIKNKLQNKNVLLVFDKNGESVIKNSYPIITTMKHTFNLQGQYNKVINYFKQNYNMDCTKTPIHLIFIYKSYKKYFKQYSWISTKDIRNLINTLDFYIFNLDYPTYGYEYNNSKYIFDNINHIKEVVNNYILYVHDRKLIDNSYFMKKIKILDNLKRKYLDNTLQLEHHIIYEVLSFLGKYTKHNKYLPCLPKVTINSLYPICNVFQEINSIKRYRTKRLKLLSLIKGDKNVIL